MRNQNIIHGLWLGLLICLLDAAPALAFYNPQQGAGGVGGLLAVSYHGSSTTSCFAAYDGNCNVAALVNANDGTISANYEYGPFGEVIRATGPLAFANPFRFSTKYQDNETDLLYYGYRFYNSSSGRWLSRDPMKEFGRRLGFEKSKNDPEMATAKTQVTLTLLQNFNPKLAQTIRNLLSQSSLSFSPDLINDGSYFFDGNNPVCSIDPLGLTRYVIPYNMPCPSAIRWSTCAGYACVGKYPTDNLLPKHSLDFAVCLGAANLEMATGCVFSSYSRFVSGCDHAWICFATFWQ